MDGSLGAMAPQLAAFLFGGLAASLGPTIWARRARGRTVLLGLRTAVLVALSLGIAVVGVVVAIGLARSLVAAADPTQVSAWRYLALGAAVGLPMSIPGLVAARSAATRQDREHRRIRERVLTRDDRRTYASELVERIVELSPRPRTLSADVAGEDGTVLRFEGDVEADEGERLTAALREELRAAGFERVEGTDGGREWWSRV